MWSQVCFHLPHARARRQMHAERMKTTGCEEARLRLADWARVYRLVMLSGAPNANYYSRSAFVDGRIDHAQIREWMDRGDDTDRALQIDDWLQKMKLLSPVSYEAVFIHYVEREPGGVRRLTVDERVKMWRRRTRREQADFYTTLRAAERYIACLLASSDVGLSRRC